MAFGYYNLLNEAVAASLGNGLVERMVNPKGFDAYRAKPESFVSDSFKDRAAKAIMPLLEQTLAAGGELTDEAFVKGYLERVRAGLGDLADAPLLLLRVGLVGLPSNALKPHKRILQRKIVPVMFSTLNALDARFLEELTAHAEQSAAILLRPQDSLGAVGPLVGELPKVAAPYLFVVARTPRAKIFVMVAKDPADFTRLVEGFVALPRAGKGLIALFDASAERVKPVLH